MENIMEKIENSGLFEGSDDCIFQGEIDSGSTIH